MPCLCNNMANNDNFIAVVVSYNRKKTPNVTFNWTNEWAFFYAQHNLFYAPSFIWSAGVFYTSQQIIFAVLVGVD